MDFILVVAGGLVAALSGLLAERWRAVWTLEREREAREVALRQQLDAIQRETLLGLQEVLSDYGREISEYYELNKADLRSAGRLQVRRLQHGIRYCYLVERVRDDELRAALRGVLTQHTTQALGRLADPDSVSEETLDKEYLVLIGALAAAGRLHGEVLRRYL